MSNYTTLKNAVASAVYTNGNGAITGAGLQAVLLQIIDTVGSGYNFMGVANEGTAPGTPDANVLYIAPTGTYSNFGTTYTVSEGSIGIFTYDGSWTKTSVQVADVPGIKKAVADLLLNYVMESWTNNRFFSIADANGYEVIRFDGGKFITSDFDSDKVNQVFALNDLEVSDENGNVILLVQGGNIVTKNFDSSLVKTAPPAGTIVKPAAAIPVYLVCNDIDTSNRWGIGSRNYGATVYLDHFFNPTYELALTFDDGGTSHTFAPKIVGNGDNQGWNGNVDKLEQNITLSAGNDSLTFKVRSVLNSSTSAARPIVLTIGDSITQGWFGNYPSAAGYPNALHGWARYFFALDSNEAGSGYDALFVGRNRTDTFSVDGVTGKSCAEATGGWTAKKYATDASSPFYTENGFSLASYLAKYKTLDNDGTTRLVAGSTAGTDVVDADAWDLCEPSIVVLELGTNDALSDWKSYTASIISSIKAEYPAMKVIVLVTDACTCNYPSRFTNYSNVFLDSYNGLRAKMLSEYAWALDNLQDEGNGVYVIYAGASIPMPYGCNTVELDGMYDGSLKHYVGVDSVERVPHPNRYGQEALGLALYSTIKYIM